MNEQKALSIIWDYMHVNHVLKKADAILVLGSSDTRVATYAAQLYRDGLAPVIIFAGSGAVHNHRDDRNMFVGTTEAEVFANIAKEAGVPEQAILIENQSQNTGDNFKFSIKLLKENDINARTIIVLQKPYMERRTFATGKVWLPDVELIVTSPDISIENYPDEVNAPGDRWKHTMVGDLQRIKEYPKKGFMIEQDIPDSVWQAYEYLVSQGYVNRLIKE